ncbi:MAG: ATP-binding protein [Bacteroidales bacterium]
MDDFKLKQIQIIRNLTQYFKAEINWYIALKKSINYLGNELGLRGIYIYINKQIEKDNFIFQKIINWNKSDCPESDQYTEDIYLQNSLNLKTNKSFFIKKVLVNGKEISLIYLPLTYKNKTIGLFEIRHFSIKETTKEEIDLLSEICKIISVTYKKTLLLLNQKHFVLTDEEDKATIIIKKDILLDFTESLVNLLNFTKEEIHKLFQTNETFILKKIVAEIVIKEKEIKLINRKKFNDFQIKYFFDSFSNTNIIFLRKNKEKTDITPLSIINLLHLKLGETNKESLISNLQWIIHKTNQIIPIEQSLVFKEKANSNIFELIFNYNTKSYTKKPLLLNNKLLLLEYFKNKDEEKQVIKKTEILKKNSDHILKNLLTEDLPEAIFLQKFFYNKNIYFVVHTNHLDWEKADLQSFFIIDKITRQFIKMRERYNREILQSNRNNNHQYNNKELTKYLITEAVNQLNLMTGYSELLSKENTEFYENKNFNHLIQNSGNKLSNLINKIQDTIELNTPFEESEIKYFNPVHLIKNIIRDIEASNFQNKNNILLNTDHDINNTWIYGNPNRIRIIIFNIFEYVIYSHSEGSISIEIQKLNNLLKLCIRSNGYRLINDYPGKLLETIKGEENKNIPIERASLGLFIAKEHIQKLDGRLWFKSTSNNGTESYITLPCQLERPKTKNFLTQINNSSKSINPTIVIYSQYRINYCEIEDKLKKHRQNIIWSKNLASLFEIIRLNKNINTVILYLSKNEEEKLLEIKNIIREFSNNICVITHKETNEIMF